MGAIAVKRGCGTRAKGGIYGECGLEADGKPLEHFLIDPPVPVDPAAIGLAAVGVQLIERDGAMHVFDWVGEAYYPNVADFLEEIRRFGLSRRLGLGVQFEKLQAGSRIMLVHRKAFLHVTLPYIEQFNLLEWMEARWQGTCPKRLPEHELPALKRSFGGMCAGLWWQDIERDGVRRGTVELVGSMSCRRVRSKMPSFEYEAVLQPEEVDQMYQSAIFAGFPLTNLVVVRDPGGGTHEKALEAAGKAGIPVDLVEE